MKKKSVVWLLAGLIILMIGGCGHRTNRSDAPDKKKPEIILSERQKSILAEQGLTTEYEKLPSHQQRAIIAIEDMLLYVEEKYGQPFSYAGYTTAGPLEKEHMRAYPASGFMETDCFTITKIKDGYEDDFLTVAAKPYLNSYLYEQFQSFVPKTEMKLYSCVTDISLTELPTKDTDLDGRVSAAIYIFLDGATCPVESVKPLLTQAEGFLQERRIWGMVEIIHLREGNFAGLSEFNFTDYLTEEKYDSREIAYIRS